MPSVIHFLFKQCYLYKNEQGQNEIVTTLLPSSASAGKYIVTHNKLILQRETICRQWFFYICIVVIYSFIIYLSRSTMGDRKSNFVLGYLCKCMQNKSSLTAILFLLRKFTSFPCKNLASFSHEDFTRTSLFSIQIGMSTALLKLGLL